MLDCAKLWNCLPDEVKDADLCFTFTVLCKSNANELRRNSANFADFAEKNANFRLRRNIGESSLIFRTSIVQVSAKFG